VSEQGNEWMFGLHPSDEIAARAATDFVVTELGVKRVAVQYVNNEYGIGAASIIEQSLTDKGAELVSKASHEEAARDVSAQLRKHLQADPEAIIVWAFPPDQATTMRQLEEQRYEGAKVGATATVLPSTLELVSQPQAEGWYGETAALLSGNKDPEVRDWTAKFKQRFDREPTAFDAIAYDGGQMMARALEQVLKRNPEASIEELREGVRNELAGMTYEGVDTEYAFDEKGRGPHAFTFVQIGPGESLEEAARIEP
jgi:branched-chain amino acid transport system substrate-binding protein